MLKSYPRKQHSVRSPFDTQAGTKPRKTNRIMCPDCGRPKQQFETERKALDFIRWNSTNMAYGSDTLRAYYCPACCCWHITHQQHKEHYGTATDELLSAFDRMHKARVRHKVEKKERDLARVNAKAKEIFDRLPVEIQHWYGKGRIRKYLNANKLHLGIVGNDEAELRSAIYRLWNETEKYFY